MRVVTSAEMRAIEGAAARYGVDPVRLLEQAGTAIADRIAALHGRGRTALVLAGKGSNGGDALVAARGLAERYGWRVVMAVAHDRAPDDHLAALRASAFAAKVEIVAAGRADDRAWVRVVDRALAEADVVLDGLLGIGGRGSVGGAPGEILSRCAAVPRPRSQDRIAIDVPTGVDADTGAVATAADATPGSGEGAGTEGAFTATRTLSTGPAKLGCLVGRGASYTGYLEVLDIGLPPSALGPGSRETDAVPDDGATWRVDADAAAGMLQPRPDHAHKGTFGRLLVVGGCARYPGAPALAALGAIHGGAGLVVVARPGGVSASELPAEAVSLGFGGPEAAAFAPRHVETVVSAAGEARAVVIGPGLGNDPETIAAVRDVIRRLPGRVATVIDADGLNALAGTMDGEETRGGRWVMTPHAAEMSRLTGLDLDTVLDDPAGVARAASARWGVVVVLKGAPPVVASPRGTLAVGAYANAALSSAGSGDVLAGLIGALLAQGANPWTAAVVGMTMHAIAAETWRRFNGNGGARASEIAARLPEARRLIARRA